MQKLSIFQQFMINIQKEQIRKLLKSFSFNFNLEKVKGKINHVKKCLEKKIVHKNIRHCHFFV